MKRIDAFKIHNRLSRSRIYIERDETYLPSLVLWLLKGKGDEEKTRKRISVFKTLAELRKMVKEK